MPSHSWDDLYKALRKGELPGAVYLHGAEDPLKDEAVQSLLDRALDPGLRDFNLDTRSAASLAPEDAATLLATLPMMADRRVVILRDVEAWQKRARARQVVLDWLGRPAPETLLILVQGAGDPDKERDKAHAPDTDLVRLTYAVDCARLPLERAARWLAKEAERAGLALEPAAVDHLVKALDGELGPLRAELGKLAGFAGEEPLGVDRVASFLGVRHGETQHDWRDAVMAGEVARAAAMLPPLLDKPGMSGVKLLTLLGQALVGTALAAALHDAGRRGRALESAVFDQLRQSRLWGLDYRATAAQWSRWAERWGAARVTAALAAAIDADRALKETTISDDAGVLTDLLLRLAVPLREAA